jgi:hypothetical protein
MTTSFKTISLLIVLLFSFGCKKSMIAEGDMVIILSEVFITDAVVSSSIYSYRFSKRDSIDYYKPIYTKLGYSQDQFIVSIEYYIDNPQALDKILDKVVSQLAKLESEIESKEAREKDEALRQTIKDPNNLWDKNTRWVFPRDGLQDSLYFRLKTKGIGTYRLSADVKVLENDESIEPYVEIWFMRDTISHPKEKLNIKYEQYLKNSKVKEITITSIVTDTTINYMEGVLLGHLPQSGDWQKYAEISNIYILFTPLPVIRDKDKHLLKVDTTKIDLKPAGREMR